PKQLGELLDDGYLDAYRLEWAATRAHNPRLKEAARVLLEWQSGQGSEKTSGQTRPIDLAALCRQPAQVGITLEEARSTLWPFAPLRGQPMGPLSDTMQLPLKDLAYAVENAWDDRVRQAAIALLLVRLDQELAEPPRNSGGPCIITPERSYAEREQLRLSFFEGAFGGALLALSIAHLISLLLRQAPASSPETVLRGALSTPEGMIGLVLAMAFVALLVALAILGPQWLFKRFDDRIERYRRGQKGEERVAERVVHALDDGWAVFRNLRLPGRRGDLDLVLVGPPGVWAVEVKALVGRYRNVGDVWERRAGAAWKRLSKSPSCQARRHAALLSGFLAADGIKLFVSPAIAWATEDGHPEAENPTVPVWTMDRLEDEVGNLWNGKRLDLATRDRITDKLTKLYHRHGP
ncbi:MAG: nuclease-related domain-containing protein, partial [Chloroflexi bacterium]|nr:nuclease-related domain-containing protein [Chloroflexota bacterium]